MAWRTELGVSDEDLEWKHPRRHRRQERIRDFSRELLQVVIPPQEAIDRRFAGDLRAYDQSWQTIGVKLGLKWNVLINLCFLGVFAPWLMKFEKFPLAFNLRYPTQRLPVPKAFRACHERTYLYDSEATVDRGKLADLVDKEMGNLTWWQKFKIFWQAPVTLFLAGAAHAFLSRHGAQPLRYPSKL
eukprot:1577824-Rhodomonas_salina.1